MKHSTLRIKMIGLLFLITFIGCDNQNRDLIIQEYKKVELEHDKLFDSYNQLREDVIKLELISAQKGELVFNCSSSSRIGITGSYGKIKIVNQFNRVLCTFNYENSSYIPPNGESVELVYNTLCFIGDTDIRDLKCINQTQMVIFEDGSKDGNANGFSYNGLNFYYNTSYTISEYYLEKYSTETIHDITQKLKTQNEGHKNTLRKYYNF